MSLTSKLKPQVHIEPYKENDMHGLLSEYIEMHTYDVDDSVTSLALITVHGWDANDRVRTVELWVTADQIAAIRDGLTQLLEESDA